MRSTSLLLFASTALSAQATLLFPRQDSSSLDSVYSSLESFSQEVAAKIGSGECVESDSCAGWLNVDKMSAKCACDGGLKKSFDTCVTCVGSDSATQTGQVFNNVCTSLSSGSLASSSSDSNGFDSSFPSSTAGSGASSSGSSTSAPPSSSTAASSSAAQPSASSGQGSGAGKIGASLLGGVVSAGLIGMLM